MQTASDVERDRKDAGKFLDGLREHLNNSISLPDVRDWVQKKEDSRPTGKDVLYELLFTDEFILKAISEYLGKTPGLSPNDALVSKGFLAESKHAKKQGWTSGSPSSANKYLFTKAFGANSKSVLKSWWGDSGKGLTSQSCPDWAFRDPCPRVVCEGKFFRKGGIDAARRELVSGIYQCFYYLAHPYVPRVGKRPAWAYTYACLFAYDASTNGCLVEAWATLNNKVKQACWDTANIFVIVLPEK
jgi:hypothetical protein